MRPYVALRSDAAELAVLGPGDIVGRSWCASLHIDDARVSEAHALVSLRGDALRLLALRGRFAVDGVVTADAELAEGQRIEFAPGLGWEVVDVSLPDTVIAVEGEGLRSSPLFGAAALVLEPAPALAHPMSEGAVAWLWPSGQGHRLRVGDEAARPLSVGDEFDVRGRRFRLTSIARAPSAPTRERSAISAPLRIVARYETVHLHRRGQPAVVLDGVQARLLSELVVFAVPAPWRALAAELWPAVDDAMLLRKRLDGALARLRLRLAEGGGARRPRTQQRPGPVRAAPPAGRRGRRPDVT